MENSIEEDIKILEEFSNENVLYGSTVGMTLEKYKDLQLSTEHILSDYERVLKDNEELRKFILEGVKIEPNSPYQNYQLDFLRKNFIPIKKIQDMIKELEQELKNLGKEDPKKIEPWTRSEIEDSIYIELDILESY